MMKSFWRRGRIFVSTVLGLAACSHEPPPPPPVLSVTATCTPTPSLAGATVAVFNPKDEMPVSEDVGANAPCFEPSPGVKSLYRVFVLPPSDIPYVVSVASTPVGTGVFAPHLTLLDAQGLPRREIPRDSFIFRGTDLSVLFRNHADERYLLVASDPSVVGQSFSRLQETRNANEMGAITAAGGAFFTVYTGTDTTTNLVYAHSGKVTVTLSAVPAAK
jgi:hypothetical protein